MTDDCIFCRIVRGDFNTDFVAQTESAVAFHDISPKAPVHILVVPRLHVVSLADADDEALLGSVLGLAARVARDAGVSESGYRVIFNTKADGGQSVDHLHAHVLGGRKLSWPPG
jgi:histidine triad (HIT) family protein